MWRDSPGTSQQENQGKGGEVYLEDWDLEAWDRIQERKIQDLQTLNATYGASIWELQEQLERMGQGKRIVQEYFSSWESIRLSNNFV
jgi:hypothetical protein